MGKQKSQRQNRVTRRELVKLIHEVEALGAKDESSGYNKEDRKEMTENIKKGKKLCLETDGSPSETSLVLKHVHVCTTVVKDGTGRIGADGSEFNLNSFLDRLVELGTNATKSPNQLPKLFYKIARESNPLTLLPMISFRIFDQSDFELKIIKKMRNAHKRKMFDFGMKQATAHGDPRSKESGRSSGKSFNPTENCSTVLKKLKREGKSASLMDFASKEAKSVHVMVCNVAALAQLTRDGDVEISKGEPGDAQSLDTIMVARVQKKKRKGRRGREQFVCSMSAAEIRAYLSKKQNQHQQEGGTEASDSD